MMVGLRGRHLPSTVPTRRRTAVKVITISRGGGEGVFGVTDSEVLDLLLQRIAADRWCVRLTCTTCGCSEFRHALRAIEIENGSRQVGALRLARAFATVGAVRGRPGAVELLEWIGDAVGQEAVRAELGHSEAGLLFADMCASLAAADIRRAEHRERNDPKAVARHREEKKQKKAVAHAKRLAEKAERDAARRS